MKNDILIGKYTADLRRAEKNVESIEAQAKQCAQALESLPPSTQNFLREKYRQDLKRLEATLKKWQEVVRELNDVLAKMHPSLPLGKGGK